eukprot:m.70787 g.70787  ORF g.70787 m.70787 type:complete len:79 (-) comp8322_c1_seq1:394-630(-)
MTENHEAFTSLMEKDVKKLSKMSQLPIMNLHKTKSMRRKQKLHDSYIRRLENGNQLSDDQEQQFLVCAFFFLIAVVAT